MSVNYWHDMNSIQQILLILQEIFNKYLKCWSMKTVTSSPRDKQLLTDVLQYIYN